MLIEGIRNAPDIKSIGKKVSHKPPKSIKYTTPAETIEIFPIVSEENNDITTTTSELSEETLQLDRSPSFNLSSTTVYLKNDTIDRTEKYNFDIDDNTVRRSDIFHLKIADNNSIKDDTSSDFVDDELMTTTKRISMTEAMTTTESIIKTSSTKYYNYDEISESTEDEKMNQTSWANADVEEVTVHDDNLEVNLTRLPVNNSLDISSSKNENIEDSLLVVSKNKYDTEPDEIMRRKQMNLLHSLDYGTTEKFDDNSSDDRSENDLNNY